MATYSCPVCGKGAYTHPQTTMCEDCKGHEEKILDIAVKLFPSLDPERQLMPEIVIERCFDLAEQFMTIHERRVGHEFEPRKDE